MWRIYRYAIFACSFLAAAAPATFSARAEDPSTTARSQTELRTLFDPTSVLGSEANANEPLEIPDLTAFAMKSAAFVLLLIASLVSLLLWNTGQRKSDRQRFRESSLQISDGLTIAPGVNVKVLRTGSYRIVVGYDRHGLQGMLLLQDGFRDVLDAAEHNLSSSTAPAAVAMPSGGLTDFPDTLRDSRGDRGATPRRRTRYDQQAQLLQDVGWELNRLTT